MTKHVRDLMARAQASYRFSTEARLDEFLEGQRLSPEERISFKLEMQRTGRWQPQGHQLSARLATDEGYVPGRLATDRSQYTPATAPVGREMGTLLKKAGLTLQESYAEATVDEALDRASLGVTDRIAVKHLLAERGCLRR
jgi:hypothetical protein